MKKSSLSKFAAPALFLATLAGGAAAANATPGIQNELPNTIHCSSSGGGTGAIAALAVIVALGVPRRKKSQA